MVVAIKWWECFPSESLKAELMSAIHGTSWRIFRINGMREARQQRENKISQVETKTGIKPRSPTLKADSLPAEPQGRPKNSRVGSY